MRKNRTVSLQDAEDRNVETKCRPFVLPEVSSKRAEERSQFGARTRSRVFIE